MRSVEPAGRADVYCLAVPTTGCFVVGSGIVVKNCDALGYPIHWLHPLEKIPAATMNQAIVEARNALPRRGQKATW